MRLDQRLQQLTGLCQLLQPDAMLALSASGRAPGTGPALWERR